MVTGLEMENHRAMQAMALALVEITKAQQKQTETQQKQTEIFEKISESLALIANIAEINVRLEHPEVEGR